MCKPKTFLWFILAGVAYTVFLLWLYFPATTAYFSNDDWVLLWYSGKIPPAEWWRYFSLKTIWLYRPLQTMQFGLTQYFVGLDYRWYVAQLLAMHLVVCGLVFWQVKLLFGRGHALLTTVIFSLNSLAPDILLWPANFGSLQFAIVLMLCTGLFTLYLMHRQRRTYVFLLAAMVLSCFTKETCVGIPVVLGAVYWFVYFQNGWSNGQSSQSLLQKSRLCSGTFEGLRLLWPIMLIAVIYFSIHRLWFQDIEPIYKPTYKIMPPWTAALQWMHMINFSLFGIEAFPCAVIGVPYMGMLLNSFLQYAYILPPILLAVALWRRSIGLLFCILIAATMVFPAFLLDIYLHNRYFYPAGMVGGLLLSWVCLPGIRTFAEAVKNASVQALAPRHRYYFYSSVALLISVLSINAIAFQVSIANSHNQGMFLEQAFQILERDGKKLPYKSVIRFDLEPNNFLHLGIGATEMVWLATGRTDLFAIASGSHFNGPLIESINARPHHFYFPVFSTTPGLYRTSDIWADEKRH